MVSGNPKGNSYLILPLQKRLAAQLCCQITRGADIYAPGVLASHPGKVMSGVDLVA